MQDEPLETLLFFDKTFEPDTDDDCHVAAVRRDLAALTEAINGPEPRGRRYSGGSLSRFSHPIRLPDGLRASLEAAARSLWNTKFEGKGYIEPGLMGHIAFSAGPSSLPFFLDAIEFSRPRDTLIPARQNWAVAGIAFVETKTESTDAAAALDALLAHPERRVRAWAVNAISIIRRTTGGDLDARAAKLLGRVAREDRAVEPRWLACTTLSDAGLPVPCEPCEGLYVFKVAYGARLSRTIEVRSDQTLIQLAGAVVDAIGWDHDHLFQFRVSKKPDHPRLRWPQDGETYEDAVAPLIGAVGLLPGHRFELLYDFGARNRFDIEVVEAGGRAQRGTQYPRVVASSGQAPEQYG